MIKALGKVFVPKIREVALEKVSHCMGQSAGNGMWAHVPMVTIASDDMLARHLQSQVSRESSTSPPPMRTRVQGLSLEFSHNTVPPLFSSSWGIGWSTNDFIHAFRLVRESGSFNFEGCRIPVPTAIRYDRMRESLGDTATDKEKRTLSLLEFGMPVDCKASFGVGKPQKNHFSALSFKEDVGDYIDKGVQSKALLGPFKNSPIPDLRFSPMMTVPKESSKRRVIVDFSFPAGNSINL